MENRIFPHLGLPPTLRFLAPAGVSGLTTRGNDHAPAANETRLAATGDRLLYDGLMRGLAAPETAPATRADARARIGQLLDQTEDAPCDLPDDTQALDGWMRRNVERVGREYQAYLARRKAGGRREYFGCRSHALYFLRTVAPTKLVDGAWLHGLLPHWRNPRLADLVRTYVEELGDGLPDKNHVLLYRRLLQSHGIDDWQDQPDAHYTQGALQLALAACADEFLPELVGFNLGYEQLPLHLLVTAYELDELGIDPYYFSLHVTVDNAASGHARRAIRAVREALPAGSGRAAFWQRVRNGFRLGEAGLCTTGVIAGYDLHAELLRVLGTKTVEGGVAHSDYCRIEGRSVNEWLSAGDGGVADFVEALGRKGWLRHGGDPADSRFWRLLQGERAEMFGVFSPYDLQVVYDWIRGDASADGAPYPAAGDASAPRPPRSFRQQQRLAATAGDAGVGGAASAAGDDMPDPDLAELEQALAGPPGAGQPPDLMLRLMGPAHHWSPAGLRATRIFCRMMLQA